MVRKKKKVGAEHVEEKFDWPFEISIKIERYRPKIAFLSGCERSYFPEDPGNSKFGLVHCLPDPDDTAKCNYVPSNNLLQKPISRLGYGIGGLLGPRFPKEHGMDNPAPNIYQGQLVPERIRAKKKKRRMKWREFVEKYERIAEQQAERYDPNKRLAPLGISQGRRTIDVIKLQASSSRMDARSEVEFKDKKCRSSASAFGMTLTRPRFIREEDGFTTGGPGTYNWGQPFSKPSHSVTNPEGKLIPRVRTVCIPAGYDKCMHCGLELIEMDYYQTKAKYRVVNKVDVATYGKYKMCHLSLCRACYCHAITYGFHPWRKDWIPLLFMKARHCTPIHDHEEGHPEFLTKSTCKQVNRLSRKELLYSRFFKDCPCIKK